MLGNPFLRAGFTHDVVRQAGFSVEEMSEVARIHTRGATRPAAAVKHTNAHTLRAPKHEGLYRYGRRCDRRAPSTTTHRNRTAQSVVDMARQPPHHFFVLLLFNTTRAHTPDPQARGPRSLWTEVWPTQPVLTQHPY